jgi:hypothetical protein
MGQDRNRVLSRGGVCRYCSRGSVGGLEFATGGYQGGEDGYAGDGAGCRSGYPLGVCY